MPGYTNSQQADVLANGRSPTGFPWIDTRDPTPNDIYYPIGQFWINRGSARLFYLNSQTNASGTLQSSWELISVSTLLASISDNGNTPVFPSSSVATPPDNIQLVAGAGISIVATPASNLITISNTGAGFETLTGNDSVAVAPTGGGTIFTLGNVVANSTHAQPLYTFNSALNTERWDIQVAAAIGATNINKTGLAAFSNAQFAVDVNGFVTLAGGSTAPTLGFHPDAHTAPGTDPVLPDGSGNVKLEGGVTFATGTQANPIRTKSLAANTIDFQIQLAGSNAAVSTPNNFGVSQFDSNAFTVTNGFVTLNGGGTTGALTKIAVDANTAPGTNPVLPSSGQITITGGQVAAGTTANAIRTDSLAANTFTIQIQRSQAVGVSTVGDNGICHFSSAQFAVDGNGFVTLAGGTTAGILTLTGDTGGAVGPSSGNVNLKGATTTYVTGNPGTNTLKTEVVSTLNTILLGQGATTPSTTLGPLTNGQLIIGNTGFAPTLGTLTAGTGISITNGAGTITIAATGTGLLSGLIMDAGTSPVVPDGSGRITLTASQVATGVVGANVIRSNGTGVNTCTLQIQRSTVSVGSDSTKNGVCHFNSTQFSVDANGYVQAIAIGTFPWTDEGGNFNASSNNGYFCTALLTATLPASPAQGDIIRIVCDTASAVTIQANTGQKIRVGNVITASAGTAVSTRQGDSIDLVYRASSAVWYAFSGTVGTWGLT